MCRLVCYVLHAYEFLRPGNNSASVCNPCSLIWTLAVFFVVCAVLFCILFDSFNCHCGVQYAVIPLIVGACCVLDCYLACSNIWTLTHKIFSVLVLYVSSPS